MNSTLLIQILHVMILLCFSLHPQYHGNNNAVPGSGLHWPNSESSIFPNHSFITEFKVLVTYSEGEGDDVLLTGGLFRFGW